MKQIAYKRRKKCRKQNMRTKTLETIKPLKIVSVRHSMRNQERNRLVQIVLNNTFHKSKTGRRRITLAETVETWFLATPTNYVTLPFEKLKLTRRNATVRVEILHEEHE